MFYYCTISDAVYLRLIINKVLSGTRTVASTTKVGLPLRQERRILFWKKRSASVCWKAHGVVSKCKEREKERTNERKRERGQSS